MTKVNDGVGRWMKMMMNVHIWSHENESCHDHKEDRRGCDYDLDHRNGRAHDRQIAHGPSHEPCGLPRDLHDLRSGCGTL